jgi:hypothetical protein
MRLTPFPFSRRRPGSSGVSGGRAPGEPSPRGRRAAVILSDLVGVICLFGTLYGCLIIGSMMQ